MHQLVGRGHARRTGGAASRRPPPLIEPPPAWRSQAIPRPRSSASAASFRCWRLTPGNPRRPDPRRRPRPTAGDSASIASHPCPLSRASSRSCDWRRAFAHQLAQEGPGRPCPASRCPAQQHVRGLARIIGAAIARLIAAPNLGIVPFTQMLQVWRTTPSRRPTIVKRLSRFLHFRFHAPPSGRATASATLLAVQYCRRPTVPTALEVSAGVDHAGALAGRRLATSASRRNDRRRRRPGTASAA